MFSEIVSEAGLLSRGARQAKKAVLGSLLFTAAACTAVYPEVSTPIRSVNAGRSLTPPPPKDLVYLQVRQAHIPSRTRGGKTWDAVGRSAPDPFVVVTLQGQEIFRTAIAPNTFDASWPNEAPHNVWMPQDAILEVELWDANPINNHPICVKKLRSWQDWVSRDRLRLHCAGGAEITLALEPARAKEGLGFHYELRTSSIFITRVAPQSPASRAQLRPGDEITSIEGKLVRDMDEAEARSLINAFGRSGLKLGIRTPEGLRVLAIQDGPIYPTPGDVVSLK